MNKHYIILIFSKGCAPVLNEISDKNLFEDFDLAFEKLCGYIAEEWPMVDLPKKPNRPGAFDFTHRGDHFQIWETNIPQNRYDG